MQGASEVVEQVVDVLESDGEPDRPFGDPGPGERLAVHAMVRGARGVDDERLCIPHVRKVREHPERLDERTSRVAPALELEAEHRPAAVRQQLLRELVVGVIGELGIDDARDRLVVVQELDNPAGVRDVPLHAQRERLHPLQDVERGGGAHARPEVARTFLARAHDERGGAVLLGEHHVVEAGVGLAQGREPAGGVPVEGAAVDEHAADGDSVAAEELRRGVGRRGPRRDRTGA